jgi:hypothetical protein
MPRYLHIPHTPHIALPVKPTDDVDVEKEYQLLPLDSL